MAVFNSMEPMENMVLYSNVKSQLTLVTYTYMYAFLFRVISRAPSLLCMFSYLLHHKLSLNMQ